MAVEAKRGCGYRKVGGLYLISGSMSAPCDRLPLELPECCPTCGEGTKNQRGLKKIDALKLFGLHDEITTKLDQRWLTRICKDVYRPCPACDPTSDTAFIIGVGEKNYPTPESFLAEGAEQGISKRISGVPKELKIGETWIYVTHPKAVKKTVAAPLQYALEVVNDAAGSQAPLLDAEEEVYKLGVICAFKPRSIEIIVNESDMKNEKYMEHCHKMGWTPVPVPDDDPDHHNKPRKKRFNKGEE